MEQRCYNFLDFYYGNGVYTEANEQSFYFKMTFGGRKIIHLRNKKSIVTIVILSMFLTLSLNFIIIPPVFATATEVNNSKLILIDPGHGGMDVGAVSKRGTLEKYINLNISLKVKSKLMDLGYEVMMTRDDDRGLYTKKSSIYEMKKEDLNNRCTMKKNSNCDLFLSIHQNFFEDSSCCGPQIWHSKNMKSNIFAHITQQNLNVELGYNKRIEKEESNAYKILRCYTDIPSVIIECGFISNIKEDRLLITEVYQEKIASSIVKSIEEYYDSISNE